MGTSFVRSPSENWRTATPRTITPATRTVKKGSGRSPACPTVFRTSSSEILVSASCRVLIIRGILRITKSWIDIFSPPTELCLTGEVIGDTNDVTSTAIKDMIIARTTATWDSDMTLIRLWDTFS